MTPSEHKAYLAAQIQHYTDIIRDAKAEIADLMVQWREVTLAERMPADFDDLPECGDD